MQITIQIVFVLKCFLRQVLDCSETCLKELQLLGYYQLPYCIKYAP